MDRIRDKFQLLRPHPDGWGRRQWATCEAVSEGLAAFSHLDHADGGDVIVYDRGYCSFAMVSAHRDRDLDFVFRTKKGATPTFDGFIASGETDRTVTRHAPRDEATLRGGTFRARPVRSTTADTEHRLATSLVDSGRHRVQPPVDLIRGRWGVEEMYGASKSVIEWFHAKSMRGVRQGLHAAFTLPTLTRRFSNLCDGDPTGGGRSACPPCGPNCAMVCAVSEARSGR